MKYFAKLVFQKPKGTTANMAVLRKRGKTNKHQLSTKLGIGSGGHNNTEL
jgi:hypothetical protein